MKKVALAVLLLLTIPFSKAQVPFQAGDLAPDFTITDLNGNNHNLYTYCSQGKYVLIDFFTYWCQTCLQTAPVLDDFYHKYGCNLDNIIVLGNESDPNCTHNQLISFILNSGGSPANTYPHWTGPSGGSNNATQYVVMAYPTLMLIGPDSTFISPKIWPFTSISMIENKFPAGVLNPDPCSNAIGEINKLTSGNLYPNPAQHEFFLDLNTKKAGILSVQIIDMLDRKVFQQVYTVNTGEQKIRADLACLSMGTYLVVAYLNDELLLQRKLDIQK